MNTGSNASSEVDPRGAGDMPARIRRADGVMQREKGLGVFVNLWPGLGIAVLLAFGVDVLAHLIPVARVGILSVLAFLLLAGCAWSLYLAAIRRNALDQVARNLEGRDPALGSKLINLLQLEAELDDPRLSPLTRSLAQQALVGYGQGLRKVDLAALARGVAVSQRFKMSALTVLALLGVVGIGWDVTRVELPRFLDPYGDHPPYSLTHLEISEPAADDMAVVYMQAVTIQAKARGHRPQELYLTYYPAAHPEQAVTVPMFDIGGRGFSQQIAAITEELRVFVHTKNRHSLSPQRRIAVSLTPQLQEGSVTIVPPAYTRLPPEKKRWPLKSLKALAGSVLEFELKSNRPLQSARIEVIKAPGLTESFVFGPGAENIVRGSMPAVDSARLLVSLTDRAGNVSAEPWELSLAVTHDLAPEIQLVEPASDSFVAMDFKFSAVLEASDDYGVKTLRLHMARNGLWAEPHVTEYDKPALHSRLELSCDLAAMQMVPGDTLTFFGEAFDNAPEPHLARSGLVTLRVISVEAYNEYLRERTDIGDVAEKYSELNGRLKDLIDAENKLAEQGAPAESVGSGAGNDPAGTQEKLQAQQRALNHQLNELAGEMDSFVRKQPLYDIESDFQKALQEQAENIRASTASNEQGMEKMADRTATDAAVTRSEALADFQKEAREQAARLEGARRENEEKISEPLADMSLVQEILKDLNRFKELAQAQRELAQQSAVYAKDSPLNRQDQLALKDLAATQKAIGQELAAVEDKLWQDGDAARDKFPDAANQSKELTQRMGDARLQMLALKAAELMVAGQGERGSRVARGLSDELDRFFPEGDSPDDRLADELAQSLAGARGLHPGQSFAQMAQCRKFGVGQEPGGAGRGAVLGELSGMRGANARVVGSEKAVSGKGSVGAPGSGRSRVGAPGMELSGDSADSVRDVNPVNRESGAVDGETFLNEYSDVVEKYFRAMSK